MDLDSLQKTSDSCRQKGEMELDPQPLSQTDLLSVSRSQVYHLRMAVFIQVGRETETDLDSQLRPFQSWEMKTTDFSLPLKM